MKQLARGTYTVRREISSHKRTQILKYRVSVIQNHVTENMTKKKKVKRREYLHGIILFYSTIYMQKVNIYFHRNVFFLYLLSFKKCYYVLDKTLLDHMEHHILIKYVLWDCVQNEFMMYKLRSFYPFSGFLNFYVFRRHQIQSKCF